MFMYKTPTTYTYFKTNKNGRCRHDSKVCHGARGRNCLGYNKKKLTTKRPLATHTSKEHFLKTKTNVATTTAKSDMAHVAAWSS